ncbi:MAG: hypothetical protein IJZ09_00040 [Tidjanibacter sp.]|nr:hypothetical protein [Tidjanibacter sp.]
MSNVLKVKVAGQRIKYQVSKITFNENDLLKANAWRWDCERSALYPNDNKLDIIRDYETFDCADIGVAIRTNGEIFYELGNSKGKIQNLNVLSAINHPILTAIDDANEREGLTLLSADVFDEQDTIYEYILEVGDKGFDEAMLDIITVKDPITSEEYIVELRYDGKKMKGGTDGDGLSFRNPMEDKSMYILSVPQEYADALGLGENKKLDNILRFDDFIKEEYQKEGKKVKSAKGYVKLREDYIHSFIDEHEQDQEPPEEE